MDGTIGNNNEKHWGQKFFERKLLFCFDIVLVAYHFLMYKNWLSSYDANKGPQFFVPLPPLDFPELPTGINLAQGIHSQLLWLQG